jgi:hypothetical protein
MSISQSPITLHRMGVRLGAASGENGLQYTPDLAPYGRHGDVVDTGMWVPIRRLIDTLPTATETWHLMTHHSRQRPLIHEFNLIGQEAPIMAAS